MGTTHRHRSYRGPALLSGGYRPFFLMAAIWAAVAMVLWIFMLSGRVALPSPLAPVDWHAHELLFGYGAAVVTGFLLTAIPNWTGRLPVAGPALAALALLWLAGRAAMALGAALPWLAAGVDLAFLLAVALIAGREIVAGRNWRNLPVLALLTVLLLANAAFHVAALRTGAATGAFGTRLGVAGLIVLISLIGGRIVPSFTRNWLARRQTGGLPVPFGRFDTAVLAATVLSLGVWTLWPETRGTAALLMATGLLHLWRLGRWAGHRTLSEPLVWVLHLAYAMVPLGFVLVACGAAWPGLYPAPAMLHGWLAGAVGLMTLAVMTRASLGHSGRPLTAGTVEVAIYLAIVVAVVARLAVGFGGPFWLLHLAATGWIGAFALFALRYWPILTRPRLAPKAASRAA